MTKLMRERGGPVIFCNTKCTVSYEQNAALFVQLWNLRRRVLCVVYLRLYKKINCALF